ncbi:MAG: aldo/keto reductase [Hyphomicrobiales bacterium]|nr:MAG: aldo/keto reductase [Hyphomicrobiales bacterium]
MTTNRLILGTANLGLGEGGRDNAFAILDTYVELGGAVIDTASVYSNWVPGELQRSETIIGAWMKARGNRDHLRVTTKGAHPPLGDMTHGRCDPASLRHDVELSLRKLQTDRIDLWFLHRDDKSIPAAEIIGPLHQMIGEGKIAAIGCSNWSLPRIREAERSGGFSANQVLGNVLCRLMTPPSDPTNYVLDAPMFHHALNNDVELQLYTSQCQGLFEKRARGQAAPANYANPACTAAAEQIEQIARKVGLEPGQIAIAYLTGLAPNVGPVIVPRDPDQLRYSYAAGNLRLDEATIAAIAEATGMQGFLHNR